MEKLLYKLLTLIIVLFGSNLTAFAQIPDDMRNNYGIHVTTDRAARTKILADFRCAKNLFFLPS